MLGRFFSRRAIDIVIAVMVVVVGASWWLWSHRSASKSRQDTAETASVAPAADGGITLSAAQLYAQGVETAAIEAATRLPVPGLPAQATAPLAASAQVVAPYAGVVTRILVDEGVTVRKG